MSNVEYIYRYRQWDSNIWWGKYSSVITDQEIAAGWGPWEFIDEKKYHEIVNYVERDNHYEVQKLRVEVDASATFDARAWIDTRLAKKARDAKYLGHNQRVTIFLAKVQEPDGAISPWFTIEAREFERESFCARDNKKYHKTCTSQAHMGTFSDYMIHGETRQAFEFHEAYAEYDEK